jgi:parallel beta-helix repeat protein
LKIFTALVIILYAGMLNIYAASFYVDAVSGNDSNTGQSTTLPWKTISKVNSFSFQPGDSILFKKGCTWNQSLIIKNNGTSALPIVYSSYGTGSMPVIDAQSQFSNIVNITDKNYIVIDNFKLMNALASSSSSGSVFLIRSTGSIIRNCDIYQTGRAGIFIEGAANCLIQNNSITIPSLVLCETDCIYSQRNSNIIYDGNYLINNNTENIAGIQGHDDCLQMYSNNGDIVRNNYVEQTSTVEGRQGIYSESSTGTVQIYNNVCRGRTSSASMLKYKYKVSGSAIIVSNTIYSNGTNPVQTDDPDVKFKNNIVQTSANSECVLFLATVNTVNINNNLYKNGNSGSSLISCPAGNKTLAQWKAAGFDTNSLEADPVFNDAAGNDYRIKSTSPAINRGYILGEPFDLDKTNNERLPGYDIGAYEYRDAVPVELTGFTAIIRDESVLLNWTTATEKNNQGFSIEKSYDKTKWTEIGFIPGAGTTVSPAYYSYIDRVPLSGSNYYRLKQIDNNGNFEYSGTVLVNFTIKTAFYLSANYPNPFNPTTNITYNVPYSAVISLKIYDILGKEAAVLVQEYKQAGTYNIKFNAGNLPSGTYIYKLECNGFSEAKKMVLLK